MSRGAALFLLFAVLALFACGLAWLFRIRIGGGDIYPAYSSLRADPLGTRALYEALADQPGLQVRRRLKPIATIPAEADALILAGMDREAWSEMAEQDAQAIDAAAVAGARVVIVFTAELEPEIPPVLTKFEIAEKERHEKEKAKRIQELPPRLRPADWKARWNIETARRLIPDHSLGARRRAEALEALPPSLPWKSDVYFRISSDGPWKAIYTRGNSPVVVERLRGRGSIVLATDAYFLSNEAMAGQPFPTLLSWLVGSQRSITFVESHLGLLEDVGVAALARRYGLAGCFFVLVIAFALWVWKRMTLFVPPSPVPDQLTLTYRQTTGLEALLRRSVPARQVVATCLAEWKHHTRSGEVERVESALTAMAPDASPVERYNAAVRALKKRG